MLSVCKDGKHGSLNRRGNVCKSEEGGGRLHLCQPSAFMAYTQWQCGVTEQWHIFVSFCAAFKMTIPYILIFLNVFNPGSRKQSIWKIYGVIFLGACSSFNLSVHQSNHISPDQQRIVKLKVNRTAFAMETKVARGWIATTQWCSLKLWSYIPHFPKHLGFRHWKT